MCCVYGGVVKLGGDRTGMGRRSPIDQLMDRSADPTRQSIDRSTTIHMYRQAHTLTPLGRLLRRHPAEAAGGQRHHRHQHQQEGGP